MRPNVFITARDRGKVTYRWEGHNTWTLNGREFLASVMALSMYDPDVPVLPNARIKHMQFGIGGSFASPGIIPAAVDTAYPAGFDPNATTGNEYRHDYNVDPFISTLERPVRFSGGTNPYASASPTDVWLTSPVQPNFLITQPAINQMSVLVFLDASAGDIAYGPFTTVPLTEAGLVISSQADMNVAYNQVVSYVNFVTLQLATTTSVEMEWIVSF